MWMADYQAPSSVIRGPFTRSHTYAPGRIRPLITYINVMCDVRTTLSSTIAKTSEILLVIHVPILLSAEGTETRAVSTNNWTIMQRAHQEEFVLLSRILFCCSFRRMGLINC
jgi:hypothetical protein